MDIARIRKKAKTQEPQGTGTGEPGEGSSLPEVARPEDREAQPPASAGPSAPEQEKTVPSVPPPVAGKPKAEKIGNGQGNSEEQEEEVLELLTFSLSTEEFAFKIQEVEEIIRHQRVTVVPTMPRYICGITSLRGKIIPVMDLKKRLRLKGANEEPPCGEAVWDDQHDSKEKILILNGPKGLIGVTIDKILGVVRFANASILEPPGHLGERERQFVEGVVIFDKRFISIIRSHDALDIDEVG